MSREESERMSADIDAVLEDTSETRKSRHETAQGNATQGRAGRTGEQCALKQGQDSSCKELRRNILQRINLASNFQKQNAITAVILVIINRITIQACNYA